MKAYVKDEHQKKGRFGGHKYRLTIAMPVSNQVKTIRRCLDSLVPLLKAVPSELIITDTGSTDGTIEIAREYTDHIEVFPWCDDMSAARNVGLRAAQGEWFMSIDDDEWFDDVSEIIEFFNSGECDNYCSASYIQRNYAEVGGSLYADFNTPRIVRIIGDIHYEGRIHDAIIGRYDPLKMLHSYVNHYGFAFANKEEQMKKFNRNISALLKDHEEFPTEIRFIYQIIREYSIIKEYKTAIEWCHKGLEVEKEYPHRMRRFEIIVTLIRNYYNSEQFQKAVETAEDILDADKKIETFHLDIYWILMLSFIKLQKYEQAISAGLMYFEIYQQYKAGKLDNGALLYGGTDSIEPPIHEQIRLELVQSYIELDKYEEAKQHFDKINMCDLQTVESQTVLVGIAIAVKTGQYERVADLYEKIQKTNNQTKQTAFIYNTESYLRLHKDECANIIKALAHIISNDPYILLNKLRLADTVGDNDETLNLIHWFTSSFSDWSPCYSDILYIAMKQSLDITPFFNLFDVEDLQLYTNQIVSDHPDFASVIIEYFSKYSYNNNLVGLYWSICLRERVVLFSEGMNSEQYIAAMKSYTLDVANYAHNIYLPEMFTEENIFVLPRAYRFGHYMQRAFSAKENGNDVGFIQNMKMALLNYPVMKNQIQYIMDYYEEQQKLQKQQQKKQSNEFAELANEVKAQIEQFLLQGEYEQAELILVQLAEMLPDDDDIARYRIQIQAAQLPKETGSKIQQ